MNYIRRSVYNRCVSITYNSYKRGSYIALTLLEPSISYQEMEPYTGLWNLPVAVNNFEPMLPDYGPPVNNFEPVRDICAPGYDWNDEQMRCEPKISFRTDNDGGCPWGFRKNIRLNECVRVKYYVPAQQPGSIKSQWDKMKRPPRPKPPPTAKPAKTTKYTGKWYGYGLNFGKDEDHW